MISVSLNYSLKVLSPNIITLGLKASTYEFWEDTIQSIPDNMINVLMFFKGA